MDHNSRREYAPLGVVIAVIVAVIVVVSIFAGGETPRTLSTVGSAIGNPDPASGGSTAATTDGSGGAGTAGSGSGGGQVADAAAGPPTLLIIRTGALELEVASLSRTVAAAAALVTSAGGFVSASDETASADNESATVTYRIPAAAWDRTLDGVRGLATVRHQQVAPEEVTGQVVDLGARIANLRATEAALQTIMARATRISDVLDVQKELTATRGEIERLVADKTQLEGRAAYGSLKVTFRLPAPAAVTTVQKGWDPATDVDRAAGKLIGIGQWATSTGILLAIVGLPLLIAGAVGLLAAWQLVRFVRWILRRRAAEPTTT
jgi:hypothetical protein